MDVAMRGWSYRDKILHSGRGPVIVTHANFGNCRFIIFGESGSRIFSFSIDLRCQCTTACQHVVAVEFTDQVALCDYRHYCPLVYRACCNAYSDSANYFTGEYFRWGLLFSTAPATFFYDRYIK